MAAERVELSSHSWKHNGTMNSTTTVPEAQRIREVVHFHYAWVLFVIFLTAFIAFTVLTVAPVAQANGPVLLGPGGKPLPQSARKAKEERERRLKLKEFSPGRKDIFLYFSAALLGTFVANGIEIVIHALTKAENGWWCGKEMAVSSNWVVAILKLPY